METKFYDISFNKFGKSPRSLKYQNELTKVKEEDDVGATLDSFTLKNDESFLQSSTTIAGSLANLHLTKQEPLTIPLKSQKKATKSLEMNEKDLSSFRLASIDDHDNTMLTSSPIADDASKSEPIGHITKWDMIEDLSMQPMQPMESEESKESNESSKSTKESKELTNQFIDSSMTLNAMSSTNLQESRSNLNEQSGKSSIKWFKPIDLLKKSLYKDETLKNQLHNASQQPKSSKRLTFNMFKYFHRKKSNSIISSTEKLNDALSSQATLNEFEMIKREADRFESEYSVKKQLGSGGHSTVRLAVRKKDSKNVVCKFINSTSVWHWSLDHQKRKIPLEIAMMKLLNEERHDGIIEYFDHFELGSKYIIVMEYLGQDWVDLYDYIEMFGPLKESSALEIFNDVVDIVAYLHGMGYCHNDIKDENVMIHVKTKQLKLIDFGSLTELKRGVPVKSFYGTRKFCSPEALRGAYLPEYQEVWALGTLYYVLLFKMDPFKNDDEVLQLDISKRIDRIRLYGVNGTATTFKSISGSLGALGTAGSLEISSAEYHQRRQDLLQKLPNNSLCIVPGYGLRYMTQNIFYPFHQHTHALYLSGLNEPDVILVLEKKEKLNHKFILYLKPKDPLVEQWDGPRTGLQAARDIYGADEAFALDSFPSFLNSLPRDLTLVTDLLFTPKTKFNPLNEFHLNISNTSATHQSSDSMHFMDMYQRASSLFTRKIVPFSPLIHSQRLYKSNEEVKLMRQSGRISGRAFARAMARTRAGMSEHQLHAILQYEMMMQGASHLAYVPVVASGQNSLILHYTRNNEILKNGDLVLVDCGGEYSHYASDITRTWPINGKFSEPQRQLYQAVLTVQKAMISKCRQEENVSLNELHALSFELLKRECSALFHRDISTSASHWIGLDLHDTPSISRSQKLKKGMTITIEPGLYIPDSDQYPKEFRGIGIRIEDNVCIGDASTGGPIVLTAEAPKEIEDIEAIMAGIIEPKGH